MVIAQGFCTASPTEYGYSKPSPCKDIVLIQLPPPRPSCSLIEDTKTVTTWNDFRRKTPCQTQKRFFLKKLMLMPPSPSRMNTVTLQLHTEFLYRRFRDSADAHHCHRIPDSARALCNIVSLTAAKTRRMFDVSVACVRLRQPSSAVIAPSQHTTQVG